MVKKCHPVKYAAILHKKLVTIHPFIDGNGRTARLAMNLALLQHGFVITIILAVLRADYIEMLKKQDDLFVNFISCMVWESQKDYLRLLRSLRD
jgi:Fic family protein